MYYDVFQYPLTKKELFENTAVKATTIDFFNELEELVTQKYLKKINDFYLIPTSSIDIVERRVKGNELAEYMLTKAYELSRKIAKFPFMKGICISGGLSKNYYDDKSDIDYFVITKANRLWICRTLFVLYYKTLSQEKRKHLCLNYFISEADLVINDTNAFVATELAYLLPTINYSVYKALLEKNNWYKKYFINKIESTDLNCIETPEPWYKKIIELFFFGKFGNWIDDVLLNFTLNHWRKKYPQMSEEDFQLQFRSRKHVCKRHAQGYQNKVLTLWEEKVKNFENEFQLKLS